jgi:Cys-tRNA(Pro)/Cys-tRNA(Cys) deacylase
MARKKDKESKLNSMRVLESQGVPYEVFTFPEDFHSAVEVAEAAGVSPTGVYKTLVVQREQSKPLLVMIAGDRTLNFKRLASNIGEKRLRMAPQREAERLTGLQVGGISPLALLNRGFEIFLDQRATEQSHIYLSAGKRGVNLIVAVDDLVKVTGARLIQATD